MRTELIYDALTASSAPTTATGFAVVLGVAAAAWGLWLRSRGASLHAGVKMLAIIAFVMAVISVLYRYELRLLSQRTDIQQVEGPVQGHWTKSEDREPGRRRFYWEWEGFTVGGVAFVYNRSTEQNYFHNAGKKPLEIVDGMWLRLRYIREGEGRELRNQIVRVETLPQPFAGSSRK